MAVQVAAGNGREEMSEQASGQLRGKQYRHLASRHRTRPEARHAAFGGLAPDRQRIGEQLALAVDVIPVVALHLPLAFGDHHATEAVPGAGVAADKAVAVAVDTAALMGAEAGTVGIADALVGGEGCRLAGQGQFHRLFRRNRPGVIEVQVRQFARHQRGVGEAGAIVFRGMLGDGQGCRHRLADRRLAARRGAGRALALADVQGDAEALVAVELDRLDLALADRGGQALLHRHRHFTGAGALAARLGDDLLDLRLQVRQGLRTHCLC